MPLYRVKTDGGSGPESLGEAIEFPNNQAARDDAQRSLAELAKERMPLDRNTHFAVEIEDESGNCVYSGSLDVSHQDSDDVEAPPKPDIA